MMGLPCDFTSPKRTRSVMRIMKQRHESGASITNLERIVLQRFFQCVVEVGLRDNSHSFVCKFALLTTGDALWNTLSAGILGFVCFTPKKKEFNGMKQISNSWQVLLPTELVIKGCTVHVMWLYLWYCVLSWLFIQNCWLLTPVS